MGTTTDRTAPAITWFRTHAFDLFLACVLLLVLFLTRWVYEQLPVEALQFLLRPTAAIIQALTNSPYEWVAGEGVILRSAGIILDKSCSGLLFLGVSIVSLLWWSRWRLRAGGYSWLVAIPVLAYAMVIASNTMRVMCTLIALRIDPTSWVAGTHKFHEFLGIIIQLLLLILCHATLHRTPAGKGLLRTAEAGAN